jgi:hypothetical protein
VRHLIYVAMTALGRVLIEIGGAEHKTGWDLLHPNRCNSGFVSCCTGAAICLSQGRSIRLSFRKLGRSRRLGRKLTLAADRGSFQAGAWSALVSRRCARITKARARNGVLDHSLTISDA